MPRVVAYHPNAGLTRSARLRLARLIVDHCRQPGAAAEMTAAAKTWRGRPKLTTTPHPQPVIETTGSADHVQREVVARWSAVRAGDAVDPRVHTALELGSRSPQSPRHPDVSPPSLHAGRTHQKRTARVAVAGALAVLVVQADHPLVGAARALSGSTGTSTCLRSVGAPLQLGVHVVAPSRAVAPSSRARRPARWRSAAGRPARSARRATCPRCRGSPNAGLWPPCRRSCGCWCRSGSARRSVPHPTCSGWPSAPRSAGSGRRRRTDHRSCPASRPRSCSSRWRPRHR